MIPHAKPCQAMPSHNNPCQDDDDDDGDDDDDDDDDDVAYH